MHARSKPDSQFNDPATLVDIRDLSANPTTGLSGIVETFGGLKFLVNKNGRVFFHLQNGELDSPADQILATTLLIAKRFHLTEWTKTPEICIKCDDPSTFVDG